MGECGASHFALRRCVAAFVLLVFVCNLKLAQGPLTAARSLSVMANCAPAGRVALDRRLQLAHTEYAAVRLQGSRVNIVSYSLAKAPENSLEAAPMQILPVSAL